MKNRFLIILCAIALCTSTQIFAQQTLTVNEAIAIALENNYSIRIATNEVQVDKTNVTIGNAGILPTVDAVIAKTNRIENSRQTRADGNVIALDDALNNNLNYGVALDWTIFDGFSMFARYDQLKEIQKLGESDLKVAVIDRVSEVIERYFDLVQQKQQLAALDTTIVISQQRVDLAQNRFTIGKSSKLEVLNAQVDLNTDQTNVLRQRELYANTKILLNQLLARDTKTEFDVVDEITIDSTLLLTTLESAALQQNPMLQSQLISKRIAELQLKQVRGSRYPTINVTTGYNFAESESSLGFTSSASARGLTYGFSARLPLFDGFNQQRNERVAKLQIENNELQIADLNQQLLAQLGIAYQTYATNLQLVELEDKNEAIAKQNLQITMEKFRIGTIPTIEFRTAQLNFVNATVRKSNSLYQAKISEVLLKELTGDLSLD